LESFVENKSGLLEGGEEKRNAAIHFNAAHGNAEIRLVSGLGIKINY